MVCDPLAGRPAGIGAKRDAVRVTDLDVVLGQLAGMPVCMEKHHEAVVIAQTVGPSGSVAIAGCACRDNDVAVDGDRKRLARVRALFVDLTYDPVCSAKMGVEPGINRRG